MELAVAEYPTGLTVGAKQNTVNQNLDQKSLGYELVVKPLLASGLCLDMVIPSSNAMTDQKKSEV